MNTPQPPPTSPASWPLLAILLAPAVLMGVLSATRQLDSFVVPLCFICCALSGVISGVIVAHRVDRSFADKVLVGICSSFAFAILCFGLCFIGCIVGNTARY